MILVWSFIYLYLIVVPMFISVLLLLFLYHLSRIFIFHFHRHEIPYFGSKGVCFILCYHKIPKIGPSLHPTEYKPPPPQLVTKKTLHEITPPNISPPGACTCKIALKYKVKQSKNGKFPSNYKLAQSILKRNLPSVHKPLKKGF